jgi:diguanylate cyclase (GGDEF)-like protein/PAS domain S-box-containing protein
MSEVPTPTAAAGEPTDPAEPHQILLVDDEPRLRASFSLLLAGGDRCFTEASSGREAIETLGRREFDLVLLDIGLPDLSGLEVLRWIAGSKATPDVIMVSGNREMDAAVRALRYGAVDFVRKPDDLDGLPERVRQTLERRRLQRINTAMAAKLERSERLHRFLVESSPDIVYTLDERGHFVFVNPRIESLLGYGRDALLGRHYTDIVHEDDFELARYALAERRSDSRASTNVEVRLLCNRESHPTRPRQFLVTTVSAIGLYGESEGAPEPANLPRAGRRFLGSYGVVRDITERKRAEETISFQALHDQLTQLPNRRLFKDHLELALAQAERRGRMVGVMFIDLDRFKLVNDTYGHLQGDELLRTFAQRLRACVRAGDTVARQGGDEFTILLPDLINADDAMLIAHKILAELQHPFRIGELDFRATASVGIAVYPRDGNSAELLLKNADIAMYKVKASGRNGGQVFSADMNASYTRRLALENELRHALAQGQFVLHYQPQVSLSRRKVVGVETLIRWQHPEHGLLHPGHFIDLAEETGIIGEISDWVLERACTQLAAWLAAGHQGLRISVNLSPLEFNRSDVVDRVVGRVQRHGLPRESLEIEITENVLLEDVPGVITKLHKLRDSGVRISIDDFGTRYSSLNYLRRFPINSLKIDQSFVRDIVSGERVSPIVHAIVGIAAGFGLHMVAEGVETLHQRQVLAELGCDEMQGYLFGAPAPAEAVTALLAMPV